VEKVTLFPFAWAQLVFYHRGPDYPLSLKLPEKYAQEQEARLQRSFTGTEQRRILSTGFIGRRRELHRFRRALRGGQRVFVFQGLGGLGKSTLAFRCLPMLARGNPALTVWCHEIEDADDQALEIARDIGDRRNEGIVLGNLGLAYADLGQVEKAREYLQAALAIARENLEKLASL
jgi:hypothetical protein